VFSGRAGLPAYAKWVGGGLALVLVTSGYFIRGKIEKNAIRWLLILRHIVIADFDNKTVRFRFDGDPRADARSSRRRGIVYQLVITVGKTAKGGAQLQPGVLAGRPGWAA